MYIINPCCTKRDLMLLRDSIAKGGSAPFEGFGDLSLTELLPAILTRYSETEMLIVAPSMPDQAADVIQKWMKQQWSRRDGSGKLDVIRHLTIVADLSEELSPMVSEWLKENPFGERLALIDMQQTETAILLPDFAVTGPVNMRYGHHFTATATTVADEVKALWAKYKAAVNDGEKEETPQEEPLKEGGMERRRPSRRVKFKDADNASENDDAAQTTV